MLLCYGFDQSAHSGVSRPRLLVVGRGLRYGVPPADKEARELHSVLLQLSIHIAKYESLEASIFGSGPEDERPDDLPFGELRESVVELLALLRDAVADFDPTWED